MLLFKLKRILKFGLLLLFSACIPLSFAVETLNAPLATPVGRVVWVKGTLRAVMPNQEERLLKKTSVIYLKDTLMTDGASQAQIAFTDHTLMTFRPDTKFRIAEYAFDPGKKKGSVGKYVMDLIEGGFRTITGLIAKNNPADYSINTPVATIGVRGTDYTTYLRDGRLVMGYYAGTPCVSNGQGSACLDGNNRYVEVPSATTAPAILTQQPEVFREQLEIVPAEVPPFKPSGADGPSPSGTSPDDTSLTSTGTDTSPSNTKNSVSEFCITN